jgi:hypothetical protein
MKHIEDIAKLQEAFSHHSKMDDERFQGLQTTLNIIKDNHLAHIEKSLNKIENDFIAVKTNQEWQLKFFWIIATGVLGALVTAVATLLK